MIHVEPDGSQSYQVKVGNQEIMTVQLDGEWAWIEPQVQALSGKFTY